MSAVERSATSHVRLSNRQVEAVEWPTLLLAAVIYGGWLALTFWHDHLPTMLVIVAGAWLVAWHGSLQHEILHGHPTRWRRFNHALGSVALSFWLPYHAYRVTHLLHHRDERLTDPLDDPESYYWRDEDWAALGPVGRWLVRVQTTLAGRLLIGPAWNISRFLIEQARAIGAGEVRVRRIWLRHSLALAPVLIWLVAVCRMDLVFYLFGIVYPATSLLVIRSFAEHRAAEGVFERTAIVENSRVLGLLFLFNNLHAAHHEAPLLPWYLLPRWYHDNRKRLIAANGGLVYDGYLDIAKRYLFKPHDRPLHPFRGERARTPFSGAARAGETAVPLFASSR